MDRSHIAALIVSSQVAHDEKAPKGAADPLAPIAGKPILRWVVDAALGASVRRIAIVAGSLAPESRADIDSLADAARIEFVTPMPDITESLSYALERLGSDFTLRDNSHVLIIPAEAPQIQIVELRSLIDAHLSAGAAATLLGGVGHSLADLDPHVERDRAGTMTSIIDNSVGDDGIMCISASLLVPSLHRVITPVWQRRIPLAEIAAVLDEIGHKVQLLPRGERLESITSAATRSPVEMELRDRVVKSWIDRGVSMPDPRRVMIDATVTLGQGVRLLPGSVVEGTSIVGDGAVIGPNTHLINAIIGTGAEVPHSVVRDAEVAARQQVQPFSVLGIAPS